MIEWDSASYQRKFNASWTCFFNKKKEEFKWLCVNSITNQSAIGYRRATNKDAEKVEAESVQLATWEPIYRHVPSGWYARNGLLLRKNNKSYVVGVSPHNYKLWLYDPAGENRWRAWNQSGDINSIHWLSLSLDSPVYPTKEDKVMALADWGPISPRLFLTLKSVYYLSMCIGDRKGKDIKLYGRYKSVDQEINDALKEVR